MNAQSEDWVFRWIGGLGHELGHALGLPHPLACEDDDPATLCPSDALMWQGYITYPNARLLPEDKNTLAATPFFDLTEVPEPTRPVYVRIYNVDDEAELLINGVKFLGRGYRSDTGELDVSNWLTEGGNVRLKMTNVFGGYTYGFQLRVNGSLVLNDECGSAGVQGCNNNDTTTGIIYDRTFSVAAVLGDCSPPHDRVIDIFDVLYKIDIILGREVPPAGSTERILCDDDCDGDIDIFDVLREIDAILGRIPQPLTCLDSFAAAHASAEEAPSAATAEGTGRSSRTTARVVLRERGRAVMLANRTAVRGMELTLTPDGGPVRVAGIRGTARSHGFVVDYHQVSPTAPVKVVLVSLAGGTLQPGRGPILSLDLGPARHRGRLRLTDVRVAE